VEAWKHEECQKTRKYKKIITLIEGRKSIHFVSLFRAYLVVEIAKIDKYKYKRLESNCEKFIAPHLLMSFVECH